MTTDNEQLKQLNVDIIPKNHNFENDKCIYCGLEFKNCQIFKPKFIEVDNE